MENIEGGSNVTEYQKAEDKYYHEIIVELFNEIEGWLGKIWHLLGEARKDEKYYIANIRSNVDSAKDFLGRHHMPGFYEYQIEGKLECVGDELKCIIYLLKKGEEKEIWKAREWLPGIVKKTEKIRILASLCHRPTEEKTGEIVENKELRKYFVKECVLVSPMIASLKKSYDHLSLKLRMCLLCLAPFPENFIIKKRLLIYWWMAEGFVTNEEVGEQNFMDLIQMGFIQPWNNKGGDEEEKSTTVAAVKGCKVHPWIRVMLISVAMEAQMFEFYARQEQQQKHKHGWSRVCLYDDGDSTATWLKCSAKESSFQKSLKCLKAHLETYKRWVHHNHDHDHDNDHDKQLHDNQMKLRFAFKYLIGNLCLGKFNVLVREGSSIGVVNKEAPVKTTYYSEMLHSIEKEFDKLYDDDDDDTNRRRKQLNDEQIELLRQLKELCDSVKNEVGRILESSVEVAEKRKWVKLHVGAYERVYNLGANKDLGEDCVENGEIKVHIGFMYLVEGCLRRLDCLRKDINLGNINPWTGDNYETFCIKCDRLETQYIKQQQQEVLFRASQKEVVKNMQNKLLREFDALLRWIEQWVYELEMMSKQEELGFAEEELFSTYDLNVGYPSMAMKNNNKWEKLLAIINVTQNNLSIKGEWLQKLTNLRALHLGRWQYYYYYYYSQTQTQTQPYTKILQDNAKLLDAFFRVAKRLRYLSLRGVSNITQLPPTISKCHNLQILDLKDCCDLEKLPLSDIGSLPNLTHFDISQCKQLPLHKHHPFAKASFVGRFTSLQTLKGIPLASQADETRVVSGMKGLRKLSIILPARRLNQTIINLQPLYNLRVLTLTWKPTSKNLTKLGYKIQLPPNLRKLDLRSYPATTWPNWLKSHHALDTLYIKPGNIKRFPDDDDDLQMPKLRVLRFKHLRLDADGESKLRRMLPSLNCILHY